MISLKLKNYKKKDIETLKKVLTTSDAGYWCFSMYKDPVNCQLEYGNCPYKTVCRDVTDALSYLYTIRK